MTDFSHFNKSGRATMVDVGDKDKSQRVAVAAGSVFVNEKIFNLIKQGGMKKGDVLGTAQIAGVMGAKKTWDIVPMCHPIIIDGIDLDFNMKEEDFSIDITATVKCQGVTGVEMEALTAVSVAALTIYDMCKALQKDIVIGETKLISKTGGKSGDYRWEDNHEV